MNPIGSSPRRSQMIFQYFGLSAFRSILTPADFAEAASEAGCAPQRRRVLIPEAVSWLMMYVGLTTQSMTQGLLHAWGLIRAHCPGLDGPCVSEEAFCQARSQLTLRYWRWLWQRLCQRFEAQFPQSLLWKDQFRVLALDGSDIDLPNAPAVVQHFGKPGAVGGNARKPQAKLVALCSVFTGFCMAFKLLPKRFTEHVGIAHLLRQLRRGDLVLIDQGFFSLHHDLADGTTRRSFPHEGTRAARALWASNQILGHQR